MTYSGASILPLLIFFSITSLSPPTSIVPLKITSRIAPNMAKVCTASVHTTAFIPPWSQNSIHLLNVNVQYISYIDIQSCHNIHMKFSVSNSYIYLTSYKNTIKIGGCYITHTQVVWFMAEYEINGQIREERHL